jgi:F420-dependent oxidoreductase-like protein
MIGVYVQGSDAAETLDLIKQAESHGVAAAWLTQSGVAADSMAIFAAAAAVTSRIKLGTSIIPTWPRPPVMLAQQTLAIASLAPGRFRLGIGPSTAAGMEPLYGITYKRPLTNLREYLQVLTTLLHTGRVDFQGKQVKARARIAGPVDVPVMASALSPGAFRLCGELAEGAISWMCPWPYLRDTALPALREGAAAAGREPPPLVVHVPVCLSKDRDEVKGALQEQLGRYGTFPVYQAMFATAGFPDVAAGYSDELVDSLCAYGDEDAIAARLELILSQGAAEVFGHPLPLGGDRQAAVGEIQSVLGKAGGQLTPP